TPKDKADTIYMVQSWQRKTRQNVSQNFSRGSEISFPTLTADNTVVEPLTIEINAGGHDIHRMYINGGASAAYYTNIVSKDCDLKSPSPYNGIIRRPGISAIRAVLSTAHGMLKFPVDGGIVTIYNTTVPPRKCNTIACDTTQTQTQHAAKVINLKVAIHPYYPEQEVSIGGSLSDKGRAAMCALLQRNLDIFAWEPKHMTGVPRSITKHKLKIRQGYSPVRQKKCGQAPKRAKAILEEVHKLMDAGIMREVYYHDWLSNPVMVKKSDGSWRMCVDFTDLNKASPQDCYPLSEIDWKVESLYGYPFKCFMDAYKGCHLPAIGPQPRGLCQRPCHKKAHRRRVGEHNISYRPRTAVKGQILADFIIEKPDTGVAPPRIKVKLHEPWILFTDGSSCVDGSGACLILTNPKGMEFTYTLRFEFTATNNEAEYEALIAGLHIATRMGARNLEVNVDSRLVANHVLGKYVAKEDNMVQYLDKTKSLIQGFDRFTIKQVPRSENKKADALSKITSISFAHLSKQVLVEILKNKSISEMEISTVIEKQNPTWMTPIIEFISKGTLPYEQKDARRIRRMAQRFELRDGILYRRLFLQPWLWCVGPLQAD
nr:reverse transcriptase domain-containing protein [Tanacetum cinerariifolium]